MEVRWVARLSNGSTVKEHEGDYKVVPSERKPWVRLTRFLAEEDLHLLSLSLEVDGRKIHLPKRSMDLFGFDEKAVKPNGWSLYYMSDHEMDAVSGEFTSKNYISVVTHYNSYEVHFTQDVNGDEGWIYVTDTYEPMVVTPPIKEA